jgi:hypothetical protein
MTRIRRLAAALAGALLACATAAPAALASGQPPPHLPPGHIHQPVHQPTVPVPPTPSSSAACRAGRSP